ncbi:MAG: hypothetical protein BGO55_08370 [Sphingobacteriales bacterium 50-39]|nr:hypothetical protein [Sphingobacteriales bacterium]OJW59277.1 MAG: hypothetical protein BGO55_08370 [Sphingobacteriales bacterium 50-39]
MNPLTQKMYALALKSPGIEEVQKVNFQLTKKNLLYLARLINFGLDAKLKEDDGFLQVMPAEAKEDLRKTAADILSKANLTEFYNELQEI